MNDTAGPHKQKQSIRGAHHNRVALALQGGGALGAYQAGVYQALDEAGYALDWVSGVSIGAINAAIIAGNPPERRIEKLKQFWEILSSHPGWVEPSIPDSMRGLFSEFSSTLTAIGGRPGFFTPRMPPPWLWPPNMAKVTSYYDTTPLRATLLELVDFDRINKGPTRLSVGAVDIEKGDYRFFNSWQERICPEHIMASGALPPGFPPVEIDGRWYWDGGLVSNTPLNQLLEDTPRVGMLVFQVDLFSARGPLPANLADVMERQKDIVYSSRTRMLTEVARRTHELRLAVSEVLAMLAAEYHGHHAVKRLREFVDVHTVDIVHMIYRSKYDESSSKDYEFSATSMRERWASGHDDAALVLSKPDWLKQPKPGEASRVFDQLRPPGG